MRQLSFLINPVSGGGAGAEVFGRLEEILDSFGVKREAWVAELAKAGHVGDQAEALLRGTRKLIAVGGDGTIGEVLDRARRIRAGATIGLIPLGTGNDLGRALGVYRVYDAKGLVACLKRILRAPALPFDLWDAGGGAATVASYLSVGLDAAVLHDFDGARKRGALRGGALGNKIFYVQALFRRAGWRFPSGSRATLRTDAGVVEIDLSGKRALLAANIDSYAAGARPVPGNLFDDGRLEVVVFDSMWRYTLVAALTRFVPLAARWAGLRRHRAERVELHVPAGTPVQIDGEDFTGKLPDSPLTIGFAARVKLLDLRRSFYALF